MLGEKRLGNLLRGDEAPLRLESRVARLRASHSYGVVLVLVLSVLVFAGLAPDGDWAQGALVLLLAALLVVALWTSGVTPIRSSPIVLLLTIAVVVACSPIATGGRILEGALSLVDATLAAFTIAAIGLGAIDQRDVNRQSLRAAVCVYLMLGMFFVFVYGAVAELGSGLFFEQGTDGTTAERFYFGFVTQATLGYGDYTPAGDFGRLLAVLHALVGQLYLVTVLALIVAHLGRKRLEAPEE
jgi:hypothetical protein